MPDSAGAWIGFALVAVALAINAMGQMSAVVTISEYAMVIAIWGLALAGGGTSGMRLLWVPLVYLAFMVPLPNFLETRLTTGLMLLSSEIGVGVDSPGRVARVSRGQRDRPRHLPAAGGRGLQRHALPLSADELRISGAVLFRGRWWQRSILFLATVPLTILMNSFRIGVIGILVNYFGIEQAEGFLHDFEGWVVFMACVGLLFIIIWIFARMEKQGFLQIFGLDLPAWRTCATWSSIRGRRSRSCRHRTAGGGHTGLPGGASPGAHRAGTGTAARRCRCVSATGLGARRAWSKVYLDVLQLSDYLLAGFSRPADPAPVGLWIAYYDVPDAGSLAALAPGLPAGRRLAYQPVQEHEIPGVGPDGSGIHVNRVEISLGEQRQLVYYWFAQRGRVLTSEYLVKWYIFQDGLTQNRTDGSLVRLTTPVGGGEGIAEADARLEAFVRDIDPKLNYYLPGPASRPRTDDRFGRFVNGAAGDSPHCGRAPEFHEGRAAMACAGCRRHLRRPAGAHRSALRRQHVGCLLP